MIKLPLKKTRWLKKKILKYSLLGIVTVLFININHVIAEEYTVSIPFGAFNPELNTPAEVWYDPPQLSIKVGDTVTWINNDREGHTVTSGSGTGRFGWMDPNKNFGRPDGFFGSERFMPDESWSYTFNDVGSFSYFCIIHPWMEGSIVVEPLIPDYPHDALGNKIEQFPVIEYTQDGLIELDLTWEPNVIKTHEKVTLIYQTYDPNTNSNLDKMSYDLIIMQNGKEVFRDSGLTAVGGDYRNVIFDEPGPIEIEFENIVSWGSSGIESGARAVPADPFYRQVRFSAMVYENPEKITHTETLVQPKQTFQFYYEIAAIIIVIPGAIFIAIIVWMKQSKTPSPTYKRKATPV